jgi:hypothetical protein
MRLVANATARMVIVRNVDAVCAAHRRRVKRRFQIARALRDDFRQGVWMLLDLVEEMPQIHHSGLLVEFAGNQQRGVPRVHA